MSAVRDVVIRRFVTVFGEPKTDNSAAMVAEYERALHGNSPEVLNRAVDKLLRKTKFRVWPTIGECMDAVQAAAEEVRSQSSQARPDQPFVATYPEWSDEAFAIADRMVRSKLGKAALEQDWLLGLHEFIRKERRYPNGNEQKEIIRQTRLLDRCASGQEHMGMMHEGLKELAVSFVERRKQLTERLRPEIENVEIAA